MSEVRRSSAVRPLGELEGRVMEIVWRTEAPVAVREVARRLGGKLAYTTVMTTLDRLYKKRLLVRAKDGNAFLYSASMDRDAFHRRVVESAVSELLVRSAEPVLAGFVDAALSADGDNLERLERLLAERRRGRR
jgi:predicted transcriptional regulator